LFVVSRGIKKKLAKNRRKRDELEFGWRTEKPLRNEKSREGGRAYMGPGLLTRRLFRGKSGDGSGAGVRSPFLSLSPTPPVSLTSKKVLIKAGEWGKSYENGFADVPPHGSRTMGGEGGRGVYFVGCGYARGYRSVRLTQVGKVEWKLGEMEEKGPGNWCLERVETGGPAMIPHAEVSNGARSEKGGGRRAGGMHGSDLNNKV
jgi:hypothetical protein